MTTYEPPAEAVEAAAAAFADAWTGVATLREGVRAALTVAGPLIERAVGERVAEGIERLRDALTDDPDRAALELIIEDAARIAREEANHG